jgi:Subtilase family
VVIFGVMSLKECCWSTALLFVSFCSYGQQKFSPKFRHLSLRLSAHEMTFSVCFRDSTRFYHDYKGGIEIINRYKPANVCTIRAGYDEVVNKFAGDPNILFVDIPGTATGESSLEHVNPGFNRITKLHHFFPGLDGNGISVSVKEKAFDTGDIDLTNRSFETAVSPAGTSQHATVIATLIAGAGNSSIKGRGVANGTQLTSSDFENLLPDPDEIFTGYGIHLQNHSYGVGIENYYGNEAMAYDQQVFANPELLHVFSAGNLGQIAPDDGTYKDINAANLSGTFKQAKNVLLVTAVDTTLMTNPMNSRGPAFDGRLKPELTAYGQGGTSDAAALVTGTSVVIQQTYEQENGNMPLASMVKAILIASADDIGPPGPDFVYGYGSLNAYRAVGLVRRHATAMVSLVSNDEKKIEVVIPSNTVQINAAVVWSDPPALPGSEKTLVHDIDAYLTDGTDAYLPWVLRSAANTDSLSFPAQRKKDTLNNVEYLTISDPAPGTYQLVIQAPELTTLSQQVSVAFWIEEASPFSWDYPSGSDILESKEKHVLFWDTHLGGLGRLDYQLNGGQWTVLQDKVDLSMPISWIPPDTLSPARLKMVVDNNEFLTDEFMISPALKVGVGFNCDSEFSLVWKPVAGAAGYEVYALGQQYMEKIATTENTSLTLAKSSGSEYFSVSPLFDNRAGLRSQTINYNAQGVFCYINFFNAERLDEKNIVVRLVLSTWLNIDHVVFSRLLNGVTEVLASFEPGSDLRLEYIDEDLYPGIMDYEAEISFTDGSSQKSEVSHVFIEDKRRAILFPNPVSGSPYINVLSKGGGLTLRVTDRIGKLLLEKELEEQLDYITIDHLSPGFYLYRLFDSGGSVIDAGKFVCY